MLLVSRPDELVTREELQRHLWPSDTFVDFEQGLNFLIRQVRTALGDTADTPRYIETLPRRGYRFIAPVRFEGAPTGPAAGDVTTPTEPAATRRWPRAMTVTLVVLAGLAGAWMSMRHESVVPEQRHPPAVLGAPGPSAARILVTSFENRTGEQGLDAHLQTAFEGELNRASGIAVVSYERVQDTLRLMRRPPDTVIDLVVGREVALRDDTIAAIVTGHVDSLGAGYTVSADLRHPEDGGTLASVGEHADSRDALPDAIRRLAAAVQRSLAAATPLRTPAARLPRVQTSSLRALQLYAQVKAMQNDEGEFSGRARAAERLLHEAIDEDPEFAAAYRMLAIAVDLEGRRVLQPRVVEALAHIDRAVALSSSGPPAERIRNEGERQALLYRQNPDGPQAAAHVRGVVAACEALLELDPSDLEAAVTCTTFYRDALVPNERAATRLAALQPHVARWQVAAARAILDTNPSSVDRARAFLGQAASLTPTDVGEAGAVAEARLFPAQEAWLRNQPRTALAITDQIARDIDGWPAAAKRGALEQLWPMYVMLGQLARAEVVAQQFDDVRARRYADSIIATYREDTTIMRDVLIRNWPVVDEAVLIATPFIEAGMVAESRRLLALQRQFTAGRPQRHRQYLRMLEGGLSLIEGRPRDAIQPFEAYLAESPREPHPSRDARVRRWLADALVKVGNTARAIAVLEGTIERNIGVMAWAYGVQADWLQNRERLAGLYRRVGRASDAEPIEAELRTLLAEADPDHPITQRIGQPNRRQVSSR